MIEKRLETRLFRNQCRELGAKHEYLLFHRMNLPAIPKIKYGNKVNPLNTVLRAKENSILELKDALQGFTAHHGMWQSQLDGGVLAMFPAISAFQKKTGVSLCDSVKHSIAEHLARLLENFQHYFLDSKGSKNLQWVRYPFQVAVSSDMSLSQTELG